MICSSNFFTGSINPFKDGITLDMFCNYCLFSKIWMFSCHPMSVNLLSGLFLVTVQCSVIWSCYNLLTEFNYCWTFLTFWTFLFYSPKCMLCFEVNMAYNGCIVFWNMAVLRVGSEGVILTADLIDTSFMKANSVVQLNGHVHKHFLWVWTLRIWGVDFFFLHERKLTLSPWVFVPFPGPEDLYWRMLGASQLGSYFAVFTARYSYLPFFIGKG